MNSRVIGRFILTVSIFAAPWLQANETTKESGEQADSASAAPEASASATSTPRPRPRVQFDPGQSTVGGEELLRQYLTTRQGAAPVRDTGEEMPPEWLVFELEPYEATSSDDELSERARSTRELLTDTWNRLSPEARARIAAEERLDAADRAFFNKFILPWGISPEQRALAEEERMRRAAWRANYRGIADAIGGDLGREIRAELMLDEYLRDSTGAR